MTSPFLLPSRQAIGITRDENAVLYEDGTAGEQLSDHPKPSGI